MSLSSPVTPGSPRLSLYRPLIRLIGVLIPLGLWQVLSTLNVIDSRFLPAPTLVLPRLWALLASGALVPHLLGSLQAILIGFLISAALGVGTAIAVAHVPLLDDLLSPNVEMIRSIAPLALWPAFMLLLGIGPVSKVAMIVWVAWIPVFLNTLQAIRLVDASHLNLTSLYTSSRRHRVQHIYLPSALPQLTVGFRLALGSGFLALIAAEMIGSNFGLGFYILEASMTFRVIDMYAAIFAISLIGVLLNLALIRTEAHFSRWRRP